MRNITEQVTSAFFEGKNFKLSNTEVHADATGVYLKLFGNLIAQRGWRTCKHFSSRI